MVITRLWGLSFGPILVAAGFRLLSFYTPKGAATLVFVTAMVVAAGFSLRLKSSPFLL
ncbi:MAG TPA: hypothetical protein G4O11_01230 [Anaerolineae bacterium]|nr:hypothetical protein [Anaerolineae bacterium]